jgi:hypothetical protein
MKKVLILAAVVALAFGFAGVAKADSFSIDGVTFTGTVTSTTVTLTVQCTVAKCVNYAIGDISLKGFTFTGGPTNIKEPSGYAVQNGGQNNGGATSCNGTQGHKAVCWDGDSGFFTLGSGVNTFQASIVGGAGPSDDLHVQTVIFSNSTGNSRITGVSDDLEGGGTTSTPEPASMLLLGLGMIGVPFLRRKRS